LSSGPTLVVATGNAGKLREIRAILADLPVSWASLADFPDVELPDEGDDYAPNAIAKAVAAAQQTGCVAVADDSGLEVAGLGGRPGPHSARYGGPALDDRGRVAHLLAEMAGLEGDARRARFVCHAALATPDGASEVALGVCEGRIALAPEGEGGFGYDPVFFCDEREQVIAKLPEADKNALSHRGRALAALRPALERALAGSASA
jgi:XTP/dITP diphosphohydrolase